MSQLSITRISSQSASSSPMISIGILQLYYSSVWKILEQNSIIHNFPAVQYMKIWVLFQNFSLFWSSELVMYNQFFLSLLNLLILLRRRLTFIIFISKNFSNTLSNKYLYYSILLTWIGIKIIFLIYSIYRIFFLKF